MCEAMKTADYKLRNDGSLDDFHENGIRDLRANAQKDDASENCVEFAIRAGIAEGKADDDIDSIVDSARAQQKEIGRLQCAVKE